PSAIATDIASDKDLTKKLLSQAGIPVPEGCVVRSETELEQALESVGVPAVIKPLDGNQGRGVTLNVMTEEHAREAFAVAKEYSKRVVVERMFTGRDYRVLVIDGRLVAASEKTPAYVIGDGAHSIEELIAAKNCDPRRGKHHSKALSCIEVDEVVHAYLRRRGRALDTIPEAGERVLLRENTNLSTGGEARDVTAEVHPAVQRLCERAARVIGLDICGLDVVLPDISQPPSGDGGIIEANAAPGIRMHQFPSEGEPRDAAGAIVE